MTMNGNKLFYNITFIPFLLYEVNNCPLLLLVLIMIFLLLLIYLFIK